MRGSDQQSGNLFSYVDIEARVPARHPLRAIRGIVNEGLVSLDAEFDKLYAECVKPCRRPNELIRASERADSSRSSGAIARSSGTSTAASSNASPRSRGT